MSVIHPGKALLGAPWSVAAMVIDGQNADGQKRRRRKPCRIVGRHILSQRVHTSGTCEVVLNTEWTVLQYYCPGLWNGGTAAHCCHGYCMHNMLLSPTARRLTHHYRFSSH